MAAVIFCAASFIALIANPATGQQTSINIQADRDNTIYSEDGGASNGAGRFFFNGRTANSDLRRSLIRFDLSSIPASSTIDSVTLTLVMSRTTSGILRDTSLHRLLADWGEGTSDAEGAEGHGTLATIGDATWTYRFFDTVSWATPGGDFVPAASATTPVGPLGTYTWNSPGMIADVQAWCGAPSSNFGWIILGDEVFDGSAKRFNSREISSPLLTVFYTPPPGACCQAQSCSVVSAGDCASAGGSYQGNSTTCSPNPCLAPTGACCINGTCSIRTALSCSAAEGTYEGDGISCTPDPCGSASATLPAFKDNTLYQTQNGELSNGAGMGFVVGTGTSTAMHRRGLVAFDLGGIPGNATITSAKLRLYLGYCGDSTSNVIEAHRLSFDWGEGTSDAPGDETGGAASTNNDATWVHRFFNTQEWNLKGGDYNPTASASLLVGTSSQYYEWTGSTMVSDVQGWINTPATNFGWILLNANETLINTQRRFESRTHDLIENRPQLVITYTVPLVPGACCIPPDTCTVLTSVQCNTQGGTFNGDGTTCTPNPCLPPIGACCLPNGNCIDATAMDCEAQDGTYEGDPSDCGSVTCPILLTPFVDPLPIPAIAQPLIGQPGGAADYEIEMIEIDQQLHRDLPATRVWGYNGKFPGPTIEARRDQPITVTWVNNLRDLSTNQLRTTHYLPVDTCLHGPNNTGSVPVTVVHFHGGHVAPDSDGDPDAAFPPGQSSPVYHYPNDQRACTLWYHDHALGITRLNVYMGLAGAYLLRDGDEDALNIPRGEFEIPLIIQDRSFNPDGSLKYHNEWHDHFFGEFVLVNGKVWPYLDVKRGKYRFRLVNGSNTRFYTLGLSNGASFEQIGSDQGLLPAPITMTSLTMAPGERADVVIDFEPYAAGQQIVLNNSAPAPFPLGEPGNAAPLVMRFNVLSQTGDDDPLPASLVPVTPIPTSESVGTRPFMLRVVSDPVCNHESWLINDLMWDDITDFPRLGTTEIWSFLNRSDTSHPIHVHLVSFQILDRQPVMMVGDQPVPTGPPVPPSGGETGWKDVVNVNPLEIARVIMRFEGFSGLYPMHCHILEHEDHEMMRQFQVLCDPPSLTPGPTSQSAHVGCSASLSAAASGDELHWQWSRNEVPLVDGPTANGSIISGSRMAVLSVSNATLNDGGVYDCRVTNACGRENINPITLSIETTWDFNSDGRVNGSDVQGFVDSQLNVDGIPEFVQILLSNSCG